MGNTIILTKHGPSDVASIEKSEAYQISLLGRSSGEQQLREQHGWWDEKNQRSQWLATTLAPEAPLPFDEAMKLYINQIAKRATEGFLHARSYNFHLSTFVYRYLSDSGSPFEIHSDALTKILDVSRDAQAAERFVESFISSIGGIKVDNVPNLNGSVMGGADYLLQNRIVAELKTLEKDKWDDYNQKMCRLFSKYQAEGNVQSDIDPEKMSLDDPGIPNPMRTEWLSILLKQIKGIFREADSQIGRTRNLAPQAKGILLLLNTHNRLHAEPSRLFWLVRNHILRGENYPNIEAWVYFCLPVPELMIAGVNKSIFWLHATRSASETPTDWKEQDLLMKCRGLRDQWFDFLERELKLPIREIPDSEIQLPKP